MLSAGSRLGPYEIVAPLGSGGMGEVYRARDTRLGREVAIKVLPQHLSANADVRARFEREAKTVSGLNHPHICTLFDVGRAPGEAGSGETDYLVMELVEGETLASRLARGPLPAAEVLRLGAQIADALDRAHRAGVIHRDLKPGNVMLAKSGAKLMDFGLARATGLAGGMASGSVLATMTHSPTVAAPLTAEGTIVGTFQYMAPEQLEGNEADARCDLWALGCVLYEMATGKRAFDGRSQASLIHSIMGSQPAPVSQLAPMSPPALDRLVEACLAKDPADRLQSAHDLKLQLEWIASGGAQAGAAPAAPPAKKSRSVAFQIGLAILAALAGGVATKLVTRGASSGGPPVYAAFTPPEGASFSSNVDSPLPLAISPDGSTVAFCARTGEGPDMLWVRSIAGNDARVLPGTEGAQGPFFSPDGRSLGFFSLGRLRRVEVAGGPATELTVGLDPRGATWGADDVILLSSGASGVLSSIPATGGPLTAVTALDSTAGETTHRFPYFLPGGKRYLYLSRRAGAGRGRAPTIYAGTVGSRERKAVVEAASNVAYASGYLFYVRDATLVAQPFDPARLATTGPPVTLVEDARFDERYSRGAFAVSANGVMVCMTGNSSARSQLRWLDSSGGFLADVGEPADYTYGGTPEISPDGRHAVMPLANPDLGSSDLWIVDLAGGHRRKLTVDALDHPSAIWTADGRGIVVQTVRGAMAEIHHLSLDGTRSKMLYSERGYVWPMDVVGDRLFFYDDLSVGRNLVQLSEVSLADGGEPKPVVSFMSDFALAQVSPDGHWLAFVSVETGRNETFVASASGGAGRWQVSEGGGVEPRWSRDGRRLFYFAPSNDLVAVDVAPGTDAFETRGSRKLFRFHGAGGLWRYDVAPDGRFLVATRGDENQQPPITLVTNWPRLVVKR